jgi:hypothetical protein
MLRRTIIHLIVLLGFLSTSLGATAQEGQTQPEIVNDDQAAEAVLTFIPEALALPQAGPAAQGPQVSLRQVRIPALLTPDVAFPIEAEWLNTGDAPTQYWEVVYVLRVKGGNVVSEMISEFDLIATLELNESDDYQSEEQFWVAPEVSPGFYTLSVLVRDPEGQRAPLQLVMNGRQADGSYPLGDLQVAPANQASEPAATYKVYLPLAMANATAGVAEAQSATVSTDLQWIADEAGATPDAAQVQATVEGNSRGWLTTPQELRTIKTKAAEGRSPYAANVRELLNHSSMTSPTSWISESTISGSPFCSDGSQRNSSGQLVPKGPQYIIEGSRLLYGKMLAAHLTSSTTKDDDYARFVRSRLLDLTDTVSWGGNEYSGYNQCILYLSWYIPQFVAAADLMESFPAIWTSTDKKAFSRWLVAEIYPKVAWASRARTPNWGSAGSYAAASIADYVWNSGLSLNEFSPTRLTLSPGQAYYEHTLEQLSRMSTTIAPRDRSDSRCLPYKGIQPGGGIPDELRRAAISDPLSMCDATYLPSITGGYRSAYNYQIVHVESLIGHAELALRRGDSRLYNTVASNGSGSLLKAIKFVIANPAKSSASYDWDVAKKAGLYIAYRHYRDGSIKSRLHSSALRAGHIVSYGRLTHTWADGESVSNPPTKPPPTR